MNRERILEAMEYIDPALIEAAGQPAPEARRVRWHRPAVIAACLCLVLAGTAVAAELSGLRVVEFFQREPRSFNPGWEEEVCSGYTVTGDMRYFPISELSAEVAEIDREITQPTFRNFSSWTEMEEFLGITLLENPVLEDVPPGGLFDLGINLGIPDGKGNYVLNLDGQPENGVARIQAYGSFLLHARKDGNYNIYWEGGIPVRVKALMLTEHTAETAGYNQDSRYYPEKSEVTQLEYVTPSGLAVTIFREDYPCVEIRENDSETGVEIVSTQQPWSYDARFVLNGILYSVWVTDFSSFDGVEFDGVETNSETVWATFLEVLDGFVVEP